MRERRVAARNVDSSFVRCLYRRYSEPATDDRGASKKCRSVPAHHDAGLSNEYVARGSRWEIKTERSTFLGSSESFPQETLHRRVAAAAAASVSLLFLSLFLSFPLRGRKFVFVSKSGRLALKKKRLRFRYRNRVERARVATVSLSFFPLAFLLL